ncbi:MAG: hypothetical protein M0Z71_00110 [Nitrospiraceae bacterium]|nr:hypothetical protein [Nitrospiraceae bacterium]
MTIRSLLLATILLLASGSNAFGQRTVLYTGGAVAVKVSYLNPTEIVFADRQIAHVILGFSPESISLQNTSDTLFVQPLSENLSGDIYVVMRDGKSVIVSITPTVAELRDKSVKVFNAVDEVEKRARKFADSALTPAGLIKAMILQRDLDGVSASPTNQVIIDVPTQLAAETVYDALFLRGFIVDMTDHPKFDIKSLSMQGLIAGAIHRNKAYFVFGGE